jgi:hypothetical protein
MFGEIQFGAGLWWLIPLLCLTMMFFCMGGVGQRTNTRHSASTKSYRRRATVKGRSNIPPVPVSPAKNGGNHD